MNIIEVAKDDMSFESWVWLLCCKMQDSILNQDFVFLQILPASYRFRLFIKMGYFLKHLKACLRTTETLFKCFHSLLLRFLTFFPHLSLFGGSKLGVYEWRVSHTVQTACDQQFLMTMKWCVYVFVLFMCVLLSSHIDRLRGSQGKLLRKCQSRNLESCWGWGGGLL